MAAKRTGRNGGATAPQASAFGQAVQLFNTGRLREADQLCRKILKSDVMHVGASHLRAVIAFRTGNLQDAIKGMRALCRMQPGSKTFHNDLGAFLNQAQRWAEARSALDAALKLDPNFASAHYNLGLAQIGQGQMRLALKSLEAATQLDRSLPGAMGKLSAVHLELGDFVAAETISREMLRQAPKSLDAHMRLAAALDHLGKFDEAVQHYERAIELSDKDPDVGLAYSSALGRMGRLEQALELLRQVIAVRPDRAHAFASLARFKTFRVRDADFAALEKAANQKSLAPKDKARLSFALGKALEDLQDFEGAYRQFERGNRAQRKISSYDRSKTEQLVRDILTAFPPNRWANRPKAAQVDAKPVFILGMPRSGTSLVEQILARHPQVVGAGEVPYFRNLIDELYDELSTPTLSEMLNSVTDQRLLKFASDYMRLLNRHGSDGQRVADKVPANFFFVGLIATLFPNASIVHCTRDPLDLSLSIYKNHFAEGMVGYSYDPDDLAHYLSCHDVLMAHWTRSFPDLVKTISYESLVASPEEETRRLVGACGLDWDDACLEPHKATRVVRTASVAQVRQPIYTGSSGISARYGEALRPLRDALANPSNQPNLLI